MNTNGLPPGFRFWARPRMRCGEGMDSVAVIVGPPRTWTCRALHRPAPLEAMEKAVSSNGRAYRLAEEIEAAEIHGTVKHGTVRLLWRG